MDAMGPLFWGAIVLYLVLDKVLEKRRNKHIVMGSMFTVVSILILTRSGILVQDGGNLSDPDVRWAVTLGLGGMAWATLGTVEFIRAIIQVYSELLQALRTRPARQ